ncbi:MAG: glycoside hydrolase family 26 protein [Caloramator sp.]|nr:glycoside hydrolase family 26 protein [Caloramator sp.]
MKRAFVFMLIIILLFKATINTYANSTFSYYDLWNKNKDDISLKKSGTEIVFLNNKYKLINYNFCYSFVLPKTYIIDNSRGNIYVRLFNNEARIDFYFDFLKKNNLNNYIEDTTKHINNILIKENKKINNYNVHFIAYSRSRLFSSDLNYYFLYFINHNDKLIVAQLKSNYKNIIKHKKILEEIIKTINFNEKIIRDEIDMDINNIHNDIEFKGTDFSLVISKDNRIFGTYHSYSRDIEKLEAKLENKLGAQMFYKNINQVYDKYTGELINKNKVPVVTFHFQTPSQEKESYVEKLIKGEFDDSLSTWVEEIKKLKGLVFIRIGNEMNCEWTKWSYKYTYNDPDLYKMAFIYIVNFFRANDCNNVYFVWNPNNLSEPNYSWNHAELYYPGDDYVDIVGLTAYNFGDTQYSKFQYFDELYNDLYKENILYHPKKPMIIGEFASVNKGGDQALFIKDMFQKLKTKYKNIKLIIWFSQNDGEYEFDILNSPESIKALKEGLMQDFIINSPFQR